MALGRASRELVAFLIFFIILLSFQAHTAGEVKINESTDSICSFYVGNSLSNPRFEVFEPNAVYRSKKTTSISTSRRLTALLHHVKRALLAELSVSLYLLSCGDISSNPGPTKSGSVKPNCKVCERTIARNHRTVLCKSCELQHHFKCAGLSVRDSQDIVSDCNRPWT